MKGFLPFFRGCVGMNDACGGKCLAGLIDWVRFALYSGDWRIEQAHMAHGSVMMAFVQ